MQEGKFQILCPFCFGDGCNKCGLTGMFRMKRCQQVSKLEAINSELDFWRSYRWLEEKGIFPEAGALCDQSAQFVSACEFMRSYSGAYRKMKEKVSDRISKIKKRNGKKK